MARMPYREMPCNAPTKATPPDTPTRSTNHQPSALIPSRSAQYGVCLCRQLCIVGVTGPLAFLYLLALGVHKQLGSDPYSRSGCFPGEQKL
eukprot:scaffold68363_cov39-Prasinocladus_malaysianus.AAC.1